VHSYLKIACSALGFEVGEVWITSSELVSLEGEYECESYLIFVL